VGDTNDATITRRDSARTFARKTDVKHRFVLRGFKAAVLDIEDVHFHFDSAVLMPDFGKADAAGGASDDQNKVTGLGAVRAVYRHAEADKSRKLLIAGHTDRSGGEDYNVKLSQQRADNVLHLLLGNRPEWVAISDKQHTTEDIQQILKWVDSTLGWDCDPGAVDNKPGAATTGATKRFQKRYNLELGKAIAEDGACGPQTWGAFFDVYLKVLAQISDTDEQGLKAQQQAIAGRFVDGGRKAVGCGENHPLTANTVANRRSQIDRRVEVLYFDPGEEPLLDCHPGAGKCNAGECEVYNPEFFALKPLPATPVKPAAAKVAIAAPECRFVAKAKTRKFKAEGTPAGGKFKWTATGAVSVAGGGDTQEVEVKGDKASGALDDSELTVEYSVGGASATERIKLTAYEITKLEAKLRGTPCRRDGTLAETMPAKSSTSDSKAFDATAVTIAKGCGELRLTATVAPAGVPVSWLAERAADDAAALAGLPTHADDGGANKRELTADATGSFHVTVFHDCAGKGKPSASDAALVLNLNIVDVEVTASGVITRDTLFRNTRSTATHLVVDSGSTGGIAPGVNAAYTDAEFAKHPLAMKVTVRLVGGGANQRRGTDKVRLGYIQTTTADSVAGTYADGRTLKEVIAVSAALADPITGGAPALLAFPVRDTRGANSKGTGPFIISSSDVEKSELPGGGLQRIVRYVDPPAIVLNLRHPVTASALASIAGSNDFEGFVSAFSEDFDENYVVVASATWSAFYGTFTAAAGWTNAGARIVASAVTTHSPPKRAEDLPVERCPPNFVDNLKMDAR
jgi:outer membrane protein OmpA-like peptidoglycan-associated protein